MGLQRESRPYLSLHSLTSCPCARTDILWYFLIFRIGMDDATDVPDPIEELLHRIHDFGQRPGLLLADEELNLLIFLCKFITEVVQQTSVQAVHQVKVARLWAGEDIARSGCG